MSNLLSWLKNAWFPMALICLALFAIPGLALVIGAVLNYMISPAGNPLLLFGGILLVCGAIAANAMAYRGLSKGAKAKTKAFEID